MDFFIRVAGTPCQEGQDIIEEIEKQQLHGTGKSQEWQGSVHILEPCLSLADMTTTRNKERGKSWANNQMEQHN